MSKPTAYLVTGGSAGIGAAIVRMLLEAGHKVVNIDYKLPENPPAGLVSYQADLTDEARTKEVAAEVTAAYNIVGLVNNAGATRPGTADTATLADLDYVVNLHLRTALILVRRRCRHARSRLRPIVEPCPLARRWASRTAWCIPPPRPAWWA